jgi:endoglucanase
MKALIQKLVETPGPSGYESQIREVIRGEVQSQADEIRVDNLGNLIVRKGSRRPEGKRIMLSAHMDEIGIIVTHIDENGFLRFTNLGGVRPYNHIGGRVRFLDGTPGVIGMDLQSNSSRMPALEHLYIDVGASSPQDCPVRVGDVAAFDRTFTVVQSSNGVERLVSKALDDRISVAILIECLRAITDSPHELFFVFTVQEEVGVRGATTAAYSLEPDLGIAVDVTLTGDTPKAKKMAVALGQGPAIKVRDAGMLADPRVVDWMVRTAEQANMPYQLEILEGGSTDARAIQLSRAGVPAGCLSIPCRYVHSPSEMVDLGDVEQSVKLLVRLLSNPVDLE